MKLLLLAGAGLIVNVAGLQFASAPNGDSLHRSGQFWNTKFM